MGLVIEDVDHIKHYGVKGQQWGVRTRSKSGSSNKRFEPGFKSRIAAGALVGIGAQFAAKLAGATHMSRIAVGLVATVATNKLILQHRNKKISEISS